MNRRALLLTGSILVALAPATLAQEGAAAGRFMPLTDLRGLEASGRTRWPELARLIDDAHALTAARGEPTGAAALRRRHGASLTRRGADRDRAALAEAWAALEVLERAAPADASPHAAVRRQVVAVIEAGLARAAAREGVRAPRLVDPDVSGGALAGSLAALPRVPVTTQALAEAAAHLLLALAQDARAHGAPPPGPLGDAALAATLARAGRAEVWRAEGRSARGPYAAEVLIEHDHGRLHVERRGPGAPAVRLVLERQGGAWEGSAEVATTSLAGALAGADTGPARLGLRLTPRADGALDGAWTLERAGAQVDAGEEVLRRETPSTGVAALLGASDLMTEIVAAVRPVAARGTVPAGLVLTTGNAADPRALVTGPEIFGEYARAIAAAEREVLLQTFVWETESQASARVLAAIAALAARPAAEDAPPVRVRLLLNAHRLAGGSFERLRAAVAALGLDPRRVDVQVGRYRHTLLGALHTKSLVVDGRVALVGGANLEVVHDAGTPWFDTAYRVEGEVAQGVRADFVEAWRRATGEDLPALPRDGGRAGEVPMLLATRHADGNPFTNSTRDPQGAAFLTAITRARRLVRLHSPNLNDDAVKRALLAAVLERGVKVELVLSLGFNERTESLPGQGGGNLKNVTALHRALEARGGPAAAALLDARWFADASGTPIVGNGPGAAHAKYASFDGHVAIVGSTNLDTQSLNHSREVNVVVDDVATTAAWDAAVFEPSFARAAPARAPAVDVALGE
ncbi:MAG: phosphatidylserine/phosphatidylglycerophosphate/cardiolipin synthase family protein [Planctomycetes bacterium]|nr:phosphatidylserine/phosphatidylglycerophosphate/cardiolipin synthase family protein [Planctomycetota bacterium]